MQTHEGTAAVVEAIATLRDTPPLGLWRQDGLMDQAAALHTTDLSTNDKTGHTGSDGSKVAARLQRFGEWYVPLASAGMASAGMLF